MYCKRNTEWSSLNEREKSQLEGKSLKCVSSQIKKKKFCDSNNYNEQPMINMKI